MSAEEQFIPLPPGLRRIPIVMNDAIERIEVTEVIDPDDIRVIRILNPFNPRDRVNETLLWAPGNTLRDYLPVGTVQSVVSVNGKIVPEDDFGVTHLERGDNLVICPVPQGGGGSDGDKSVMSMIAMVVVMIFASYAAPELAALMGGAQYAGLAQGMIMMAGSMVVQTVFAPSKKTDAKESKSYGVDGAKNTSLEGIPVPVTYGTFRLGGNLVQVHTEGDGETDNQVLYLLINAGEGPVAGLSDLQINDQPIGNYTGAEYQLRLGMNDQVPIPWFSSAIVPQTKNLEITEDWITHTTLGAVDKVRLDLVAPQGIYFMKKMTGDLIEISVDFDVELRKQGDSTWQQMQLGDMLVGWRKVRFVQDPPPIGVTRDEVSGQYYSVDASGYWVVVPPPGGHWVYADGVGEGELLNEADAKFMAENGTSTSPVSADGNADTGWIINPNEAVVPVYSNGVARIKSKQKSTLRRSFTSQVLEQGVYDVRIRKRKFEGYRAEFEDGYMEKVFLADVNEIQLEPLSYPNTALVGVRVVLSEALTGLPKVTYLNHGKIVSVYGRPVVEATQDQWYSAPSANPAWIVWDMLTNRRYGGGVPTSRLDLAAFKRWADYCDEAGLEFSGTLDSEMNVWDATQLVLRVGHAQLVNVGTRFGIVVEKPDVPVMMFSVANMIKDSYKESWMPVVDRANEVDVTFYDKADSYKQRTIKVYDPEAMDSRLKQRSSAVTLVGVVDAARAYREGQFMMNLNRFILKTVNFSAPLEALACTVGDLIYVQHDMPNWAQAGRFAAGSTASVLSLDRPAVMEVGKSYKALVLHDKLARYTGVITNIIGNTLVLSGFGIDQPVKRLVVGDIDVRINDVYVGNCVVESVTGITIGAAYTAYDTDVVEERGVVLSAGEHETITLQSPLTVAPAQFAQWMFGEVDKVKQIFRIKSINASSEQTREITAVQYDERIFQYDRFASLELPVASVGTVQLTNVLNLELYEQTYIEDSALKSHLVATWDRPFSGIYGGADVYVRRGDPLKAKFTLLGAVDHRSEVEIPATRGEEITVKVVAFDLHGARVAYDTAPEASLKVVGEVPGIAVGSVSGADVVWAGKDCRLTWRYNSVTKSYEFGSEPVGADAGSLDSHFKDYEVKVFAFGDDPDKAEPRRTESVTTNSYVYSYEKNLADGIARKLKFSVRMRDQSNNLGAATILTAENTAPATTSVSATPTFETVSLAWGHSVDADFAGTLVWLSSNPADLEGDTDRAGFDEKLVYNGPDSAAVIGGLMFNQDYYVRVAAYDVFGRTGLNPSAIIHFKTTHLDVNAIAEGVIGESKLLASLQERIALIDAPSTVGGSVAARLLAEATARGEAIASETTQRQDSDSALTQQANVLQARLRSRPNLVPNGGFERGLEGWVGTDSAISQFPEWGAAFLRFGTPDGVGSIASAQFPIQGGITYTLAGDSHLIANPGCFCYFDTIFYDAAGAAVFDSLESAVTGAHTFATDDSNRAAHAVQVTAPATAVKAAVRFVWSGTGISSVACRQVKMERGPLPYTPYSSEQTTGDIYASVLSETTARVAADAAEVTARTTLAAVVAGNTSAIDSANTARVNGDAAEATARQTLAASIGTGSANLLENSEFAANLDGWTPAGSYGSTNVGRNLSVDWVVGDGTAFIHDTQPGLAGEAESWNYFTPTKLIPVQAGKRYQLSAYTAAHRCTVAVYVDWHDVNGTPFSSGLYTTDVEEAGGGKALAYYKRHGAFDYAPAGAAFANFVVAKRHTRTGEADSYAFFTRLFFGEARAEQTVVDPYSAGPTARTTFAAIANEQTVRADAVSAVASSVSTLQTTVNGNTSSISTQQSSINGLSAQWSLKTDVNGYVAGFGFANTVYNGTPASEFALRVDKFSMQMPGYPGVYPFTIGVVNGVPRVIMNSAIIGDATIGSAKIGYLEVQSSNIQPNAVTDSYVVESTTTGTQVSVTVTVPANAVGLIAFSNPGGMTGVHNPGEDNLVVTKGCNSDIYFNGTAVAAGSGPTHGMVRNPAAGNWTILTTREGLSGDYTSYIGKVSLVVMILIR